MPGELTLQQAAVSPAELLGRVALAQQVQAEQKGVKLAVEADETLPPVHADPERIAQVFGNLLSNALRYTPAGGEIRLTADGGGRRGRHASAGYAGRASRRGLARTFSSVSIERTRRGRKTANRGWG